MVCIIEGDFRGAAWSPDGESIIFHEWEKTVPQTVSAKGGEPQPAFRAPAGFSPSFEVGSFVPNSNGPKVLVATTLFERRMEVLDLNSGERLPLGPGWDPVWSPTGHALFQQGAALWARSVSLAGAGEVGEQTALAANARSPSVSRTGRLVYLETPEGGRRMLIVRDRGGRKISEVGEQFGNRIHPQWSPDGRRVVALSFENNNADVWAYDLAHHGRTRLTSYPGPDTHPVWSPDSRMVTLQSLLEWPYRFIRGTGAGDEVRLFLPEAGHLVINDWSHDSKYLVGATATRQTVHDLWDFERRPDGSFSGLQEFVVTPFQEHSAVFSPDHRYVTYCSNESGRYEIYVHGFPTGGRRWQVSAEGGTQPRWSRDGREIFYVEGDRLMAVPVLPGREFSIGPAQHLFSDPQLDRGFFNRSYDVSPNGQSFVMAGNAAEDTSVSIHVVQNWLQVIQD